VGCLLGLAATYLVALHTDAGARRDLSLYREVSGYASYPVRAAGARALRTIDVGSVAVALALLLFVGAVQRRAARAVAAIVVVVLSVGTAELLKHGLPHVAHGLPGGREATWPSGHTAVAVSLGLALVLASPAVARPTAALAGAAYGAGIGLSVIVLGWHFPSDVVGSFFISGFWACVAARVVPERAGRAAIGLRGVAAAVLVVAAGLGLAAALARAHPGAVAVARSVGTVTEVAAVIGILSIALFAAFTPLASRR
jgi:membrane-associated phospholipid phosphatase